MIFHHNELCSAATFNNSPFLFLENHSLITSVTQNLAGFIKTVANILNKNYFSFFLLCQILFFTFLTNKALSFGLFWLSLPLNELQDFLRSFISFNETLHCASPYSALSLLLSTSLNYRQTRQALTSHYLIFLSLGECASYCNETVELGENDVNKLCFPNGDLS